MLDVLLAGGDTLQILPDCFEKLAEPQVFAAEWGSERVGWHRGEDTKQAGMPPGGNSRAFSYLAAPLASPSSPVLARPRQIWLRSSLNYLRIDDPSG